MVTVMSTVAAAPAGAVTTMALSEITANDVAWVAPKATAVAPVKLLPLIVMVSPPRTLPLLGETLVMLGVEAAL